VLRGHRRRDGHLRQSLVLVRTSKSCSMGIDGETFYKRCCWERLMKKWFGYWSGWPYWANFRLLDACFLWVVY
jgi:hypothetical protein